MNATFNIQVSIDANRVSTSFGSGKIEDMDTALLASVLKVFGDVQNKVNTQVAKFYCMQKEQPEEVATAEEPTAGNDSARETQEQDANVQ